MNPAQSLYDYLLSIKERVAPGNVSVGKARGLATSGGMHQQMRAVIDLVAIREGINELEAAGLPVATYRKYEQGWAKMVMSFPEGWGQNVDAEATYPMSTLDHLHTLAGWFATTRPLPSKRSQGELKAFLLDVQKLLEADDSISGELKAYLNRLIREMQNALDDAVLLKRFDFDEAGRRLWTGLFAASAQTQDEEKKSAWTDLANKLWWPTAAGVLGSAPSIISGVLTATAHN
ncbi:hypothetical protein [Curtobacterium sp. SL109]|uniref:hypothetical protein n=1 Tax=Curtobacterium sp. SL109 TaxID=2994662 RepID=UPI0022765D48|nr:hypothetical protein [Curtobacterium sp. SL109]MCY1696454.1 hypothetical protein [Curtobacterium sp. SL109]